MTTDKNPENTSEQQKADFRKAALEYHEFPTPGKIAIAATKQLTNQRDLALAYSYLYCRVKSLRVSRDSNQ